MNIHDLAVERFGINHPCETCGKGSRTEVEFKTGDPRFFCDLHAPHVDEFHSWGHETIDMKTVKCVIVWTPVRSGMRVI